MSFTPKFAPFIDACRSVQRRFADTFNEKSFSRRVLFVKKSENGNWSGIVAFVSLLMKKTVESQQNNSRRGKTE